MSLKPHDFTKPTRLAVAWQQRLTTWCRSALALAAKQWAKQLPAPLEVSLTNLDVAYAQQAFAGLTENTLVYRVKLGDRLVSTLALPRPLMLNLVGFLLGENAPATDRDMTLIEEKLADYFLVNHWLAFFRESWPGANAVAWMLDGTVPTPSAGRLYADTEVMIAASFDWCGGWGAHAGAWYFPKKILLELLGNVDAAAAALPDIHVAARREAIVQRLPMPMQIVLGSAELRLSDLSSLRVGDVVVLDRHAADGVTIRIGGKDFFAGRPGRMGTRTAIQVQSNLTK